MPALEDKIKNNKIDRGSRKRGFGVYVHWPFCRSKCPYCDFNSHVRSVIDEENWRQSYLSQIKYFARLLGRRKVDSIFFGGGTPSLMDPATVDAVLDEIFRHWSHDSNIEVTLEANPTSSEVKNFKSYKRAGVNRLSLGVQSFNENALKWLGRDHSVSQAMDAIELMSREVPRWSFDLIYALPGQTEKKWRKELTCALGLGATHLSLYQLTIEPGTEFFKAWKLGKISSLDEDTEADLFLATDELCAVADLPAYEISNYAKLGDESYHNQNYWNYGEYIGIGPGAHGRPVINGERYATMGERLPERWLRAVGQRNSGLVTNESLDIDEVAREMLMMGLRLVQGVSREEFNREIGVDPFEWCKVACLELQAQGLLRISDSCLATTPRGRPLTNRVTRHLLRFAKNLRL